MKKQGLNDWIEMKGYQHNASISKTLDLDLHTDYMLSFYANDRSNRGALELYFGGELIDTIDADGDDFQRFEYTISGGSGDRSDMLTFREIGPSGAAGTGLTNVSVEKQ